MSRRKVQGLLAAVFGLEVSLGALSESEQIVSDAVAPAVEAARVHALAARTKYVDATSWSQAGAYRSLWTLATASVTVFTIVADGTRDTLRQWIDRTRGVLVTDRGSQFGFWAMDRRQICWAHLIRKFAAFSERRGRPGEIGADLLLWSHVLLHAWHRVRDGTGTRADLKAVVLNLRAQIELRLDEGAAMSVQRAATSSTTARRCGASCSSRASTRRTTTPSASCAGWSAGGGRPAAAAATAATCSRPTWSP
jgi:transposase